MRTPLIAAALMMTFLARADELSPDEQHHQQVLKHQEMLETDDRNRRDPKFIRVVLSTIICEAVEVQNNGMDRLDSEGKVMRKGYVRSVKMLNKISDHIRDAGDEERNAREMLSDEHMKAIPCKDKVIKKIRACMAGVPDPCPEETAQYVRLVKANR